MNTVGGVHVGVVQIPEKIEPPACYRCGQPRPKARPKPGKCNDCRFTTRQLTPAQQRRLDAEVLAELGLEEAA